MKQYGRVPEYSDSHIMTTALISGQLWATILLILFVYPFKPGYVLVFTILAMMAWTSILFLLNTNLHWRKL